jgi:hypothetical protein
MRRRTLLTLIALAAVGVFLFLLAPPAPERVDVSGWDDLAARTVPGAYHVHTTRSDGNGDKAVVAKAAASAGLKFVILTDHGDGTRPPDAPEYVDGVLMLDCVEISTDQGHYVAIEMARAPYPLGGAAYAVVEDVQRLGGFGIAAHPDSPKAALRWTGWDARIDGIEWLNADSEWRDEPRSALLHAGIGYFLRSAPSLATLLDRPATLDRWDALLKNRRVVAIGASDAHGGPGRRAEDANRTFFSTIGIPSYEASFRELSLRAVLERPLSGNPEADAKALFKAIRKGSVFTVIDALATPALLDFHAVPSGASVTLFARATLPRGAQLVLIGPAGELVRGAGEVRREVPAETPGAYRVEVRLPGAPGQPPVPWLVSNAIRVGPDDDELRPESWSHGVETGVESDVAPFPWRIEKDPASGAILRTGRRAVDLEYRLADGARNSQFVALASDVSGQAFRAIDLTLGSDRPSRIAIQVRSAAGQRWGRSFYIDPGTVLIHAALRDMRPVDDPAGPAPDPAAVTSILLVADLTNAAPGRSGRLTVKASALMK